MHVTIKGDVSEKGVITLLDIDIFQKRLKSFPSNYMKNFNYVWEWKISKENGVNSILSDKTLFETHFRLSKILNRWQTYRNGDNTDSIGTLKQSLRNIVEAYYLIKDFSLLEFDKVPIEPLAEIWHELGRVKEAEGKMNEPSIYSIIAVCKPLLLIWGQTLAFDSRVRKNMDKRYQIPKYQGKWVFREWIDGMNQICKELNESPECIQMIEMESHKRYGTNTPVPYGRFLDIYYFEGR